MLQRTYKEPNTVKGIVYVSEARVCFDWEALRELETQAAQRNRELGITGYLFFAEGRFMQYVEGVPASVSELMVRIKNDPRHRVLVTAADENVLSRRFPLWHMHRVTQKEIAPVRLENVLTDYLRLIKPLPEYLERWQEVVWGIVNRIALLQNRPAVRR